VAPGPHLPAVELHKQPLKSGDAYTVWGLGYALRSRQHRESVTSAPITVTGTIGATNLAEAPPCAVHPADRADPENCMHAVPLFWLCDRPDAALSDCVKVLGFASNFAQIHDAIQHFDRGQSYLDTFFGVTTPNPLPAVGARVTVKGTFGTTYAKASSGSEADDIRGIVTFASMTTLEPASEPATLPGMKRKLRPH
jgi:hypothetical protein